MNHPARGQICQGYQNRAKPFIEEAFEDILVSEAFIMSTLMQMDVEKLQALRAAVERMEAETIEVQ